MPEPVSRRRLLAAACIAPLAALPAPAMAADASVIEARMNLAVEKLYREVPGARALADRARGMLVMPKVVKGGFLIGGSYGEGGLRLNRRRGDGALASEADAPADGADPGTGAADAAGPAPDYGPTVAYYSVAAASIGLQAGVQETSHVLFFLTDEALGRFRRADGWEIGADAEITALDKAVNLGVDSTRFDKPVVAIVFGGSGLMVGASLEGAKYSAISR